MTTITKNGREYVISENFRGDFIVYLNGRKFCTRPSLAEAIAHVEMFG